MKTLSVDDFRVGASGPRSQQEYDAWLLSEQERLDRQYNVIHSAAQLIGWEILLLRRYKPGVVSFHARRPCPGGMEFQTGLAKDELFAAWQLPPLHTP